MRPGTRTPPTHPPEPTYPCCLPALGEFSQIAPREGLRQDYPIRGRANDPVPIKDPAAGNGFASTPQRLVLFAAEDSPRGLGRTLGKRVGGNPSRVRISYPPQSPEQAKREAEPRLWLGFSACAGCSCGCIYNRPFKTSRQATVYCAPRKSAHEWERSAGPHMRTIGCAILEPARGPEVRHRHVPCTWRGVLNGVRINAGGVAARS